MDLMAAPCKHLTQTQTRAFMVYGVNLCVFVLMSDYEAESSAAVASENLTVQSLPHHDKATSNYGNTRGRHLK